MPKLRLPTVPLVPLCLKVRGRIVGAISGNNTSIYIGSGLIVIATVLLSVILVSVKYDLDSKKVAEQNVESQATVLVEPQPTVVPQPVSEIPPAKTEQEAVVPVQPIKGEIIVDFGWQLHQVYQDWRYHTGIDIKGFAGQTVKAVYGGKVIDIVRDLHSGLTVVVKNDDYTIYYGSLAEANIEKGSSIKAGQVVGTIGSCDAEPYSHLHLAIKKEDQYIDPKTVIPR